MSDQSGIVPFPSADSLNDDGQHVLELLRRAGEIAEQNTRYALNTAHKLSMELRAAEDRVNELQASVKVYKQRAEKAEEWMRRIAQEIEQRFNPVSPQIPQPATSHPAVEAYAPRRR
jgi:hypothetical protein